MMPSFRSAKNQAEHAVSERLALGQSRHDSKDDGRIHSLGTARAYGTALSGFVAFLNEHHLGDLGTAGPGEAMMYLLDRSEVVNQATLDLDRQALNVAMDLHGGDKLERVMSNKETHQGTRSYTRDQISMVASAQSVRNALATKIAAAAGLRAHELITLERVTPGNRQASGHREWSDKRFEFRDGDKYTVIGKGGLIREVLIPHDLATLLEDRKLENHVTIVDRGVLYEQSYDIGGGHAWSRSFSAASQRTMGWSNGAHGVRHTYAQQRMDELQARGYTYNGAKAVVAQELGHFAPDTTEAYLR
jgi:integrase